MLSCKQVARLVSEGLDHRLSIWQRMGMRLHLMMCSACSGYKRQVEMLHRLVRRRYSDRNYEQDRFAELNGRRHPLPEQTRTRIKEALRGGK